MSLFSLPPSQARPPPEKGGFHIVDCALSKTSGPVIVGRVSAAVKDWRDSCLGQKDPASINFGRLGSRSKELLNVPDVRSLYRPSSMPPFPQPTSEKSLEQ